MPFEIDFNAINYNVFRLPLPPLPKKKEKETVKREKVVFSPHEKGQWYKQTYNANSVCDWGLVTLKSNPTREEVSRYSISEKREWIEQHLDRRVQLFFQQAILCYNTPFVFEEGVTEAQYGQGNTLKMNGQIVHKTQAAHSSTLPCLYACPKKPDGSPDRQRRFVLHKGSHAYLQHNATMELPSEVNEVDSRLDWKTKGIKLRQKSLAILNQCAQGKFNPVEATKEFLQKFRKGVELLETILPEEDQKKLVVQFYRERAREIKQIIAQGDEVFDQLMGVKIAVSDKEALLREIVYRRKYSLIQESERIQSEIAGKILSVQGKIIDGKSKSKKVDPHLRYLLIKEMREGKERRCLERLFCTSIEQLEASKERKKTLRGYRVEDLSKSQKKEFDNLIRDVRVEFYRLQNLELNFRAQLLKGLREEFKDWRQKEFSVQFKALYPSEPMSQSMVCRLEKNDKSPALKTVYFTPENQRKKEMTVEKAQMIAATLTVDPGLFLPALFTSSY